jgi:hypothetical protein
MLAASTRSLSRGSDALYTYNVHVHVLGSLLLLFVRLFINPLVFNEFSLFRGSKPLDKI